MPTHVAAAIDSNGGMLGIESFPADLAGFEALLGWLTSFGEVSLVGVEGTGSWGVGLSRFLHDQDVEVVEVDRPNCQARRKVGKSDPTDAVAAARGALSGAAAVIPKTRNGSVQQMGCHVARVASSPSPCREFGLRLARRTRQSDTIWNLHLLGGPCCRFSRGEGLARRTQRSECDPIAAPRTHQRRGLGIAHHMKPHSAWLIRNPARVRLTKNRTSFTNG